MTLRRRSDRDERVRREFDPTPYVDADFPPILQAVYRSWLFSLACGVTALSAALGFLTSANEDDRFAAIPASVAGALMLWASRASYLRRRRDK